MLPDIFPGSIQDWGFSLTVLASRRSIQTSFVFPVESHAMSVTFPRKVAVERFGA